MSISVARSVSSGTNQMNRREAIYLDLIRSLAAFIVVLDHAPTVFNLPGLPRWGHQAVMVFFVLSGYVICHTADTRETSPRAFIVARFARLWSVLVPAMVLTVFCDVAGRMIGHHPGAYAFVPANLPLIRVGAVLVFLSESWVSIQPLSNGVVWSLCAEFWYYMLFAAWVFVPPGRMRKIALAIAVLLSGHKALLLLPIWLMGVALQRSRSLRRFNFGANVTLWFAGFLIVATIATIHAYNPAINLMKHLVSPWIFTQLAEARVFWFDWVFGLAVAAHLLGARDVANRLPMERIAAPVRWCAGISFAAYLFHVPLLHFWAAILGRTHGWIGITLTLAVIALLGPPVERSKRWWRRQLDLLLGYSLPLIKSRAARPSPRPVGALLP
jgi:peptidoglycan/LPS O-acetylase OafA/YrhL